MTQPATLLPTEFPLYFRAYGKAVLITAVFTSNDDANAYMEKTPGASVIAVSGAFVFIADKENLGIPPDQIKPQVCVSPRAAELIASFLPANPNKLRRPYLAADRLAQLRAACVEFSDARAAAAKR